MIPLTFLYEEYIDGPKLSEQKNPFEYLVPSPTSGVGTMMLKQVIMENLHYQKKTTIVDAKNREQYK